MFRRVNASDLDRDVVRGSRASHLALGALFLSPLVLGCYGILSGHLWLAIGGFLVYALFGSCAFVLALFVSVAPRRAVAWLDHLHAHDRRWVVFIAHQFVALACAFFLALILHIMAGYLVTGAS